MKELRFQSFFLINALVEDRKKQKQNQKTKSTTALHEKWSWYQKKTYLAYWFQLKERPTVKVKLVACFGKPTINVFCVTVANFRVIYSGISPNT